VGIPGLEPGRAIAQQILLTILEFLLRFQKEFSLKTEPCYNFHCCIWTVKRICGLDFLFTICFTTLR